VRIDDKYRLPLRLGCVAVGYLAYRLLEPTHFAGALLVGLGIWLAGVSVVERAMTDSVQRLRRIQAIGTTVGVAMIVIGISLVVL
jgi:arginine exporter protein ArgO